MRLFYCADRPRFHGGGACVIGLIMFCLAMFVQGCAKPTGSADINFALSSAPVTLDPRYATDATSVRINRLLYRQLVDFDHNYDVVPDLAEVNMLTPRHFRFVLGKEGRRFHDGTALDAHDVKASFDSILAPATASPLRATLSIIEKITVVNPDTVDFYLARDDILFPGYLTIGILPSEKLAAGHAFNSKPVGSGAFRLLDWDQQDYLQLLRLRDKRLLRMQVVKDVNTRVLKLMKGEVDILQNDLYPELLSVLRREQAVKVQIHKGSNFSYLGFNLKDPVVSRWQVRRAIALALDRDAIIKHLFAGAARKAASILPPNHWAGSAQLPVYAYDPAQARSLLAALGFDERNPLVLEYKTSQDPFRIRLATVIQSQLSHVGIKVKLKTYDWGTFYGDIKGGNFQMYSLAWVGIHLPDIFRFVFHSEFVPPNGANRGHFSDQEVDHLIEQAHAATDRRRQQLLYERVQQKVVEKLPYVPLWYEDHVSVVRQRISNYTMNMDGNYDGLKDVELVQDEPAGKGV